MINGFIAVKGMADSEFFSQKSVIFTCVRKMVAQCDVNFVA